MTPLVLVATPVAVLAVVLLLGFVGCDQLFGLDEIASQTFEENVQGLPSLVAFWHLDEPSGPFATDHKGTHHASYMQGAVAEIPDESPPAPGTLEFDQPSLIGNSPARRSIAVNGGYAEAAFSADLNAPAFTVGGWVRTNWSPNDPTGYRCVVFSAEDDTNANRGFALYADPAHQWVAVVGDGNAFHTVGTGGAISLGTTDYLAMTYDGTTLTLYVNGELRGSEAVAFLPSESGPFRIGQRASAVAPFNGRLQDVFYCSEALSHHMVLAVYMAAIM